MMMKTQFLPKSGGSNNKKVINVTKLIIIVAIIYRIVSYMPALHTFFRNAYKPKNKY